MVKTQMNRREKQICEALLKELLETFIKTGGLTDRARFRIGNSEHIPLIDELEMGGVLQRSSKDEYEISVEHYVGKPYFASEERYASEIIAELAKHCRQDPHRAIPLSSINVPHNPSTSKAILDRALYYLSRLGFCSVSRPANGEPLIHPYEPTVLYPTLKDKVRSLREIQRKTTLDSPTTAAALLGRKNQKQSVEMAERKTHPSVGTVLRTTFDNFKIAKILGEGGVGKVFIAKDTSNEEFAIKILKPEHVTGKKRKRFKNEITFGVKTKHKNVVEVLDHGITEWGEEDVPFYVMRKYSSTLRALMPNISDPEKKLKYFLQILDGVEAIHLSGVFHRDIKPENILFSESDDSLVIADLGIAHFSDEELFTAAETKANDRLANFVYAAPEQRDRGKVITVCADIYALGLILNELFTGQVPHGTGFETIAQRYSEFSWLDELVTAMLQQNPLQRPQSIDDVKKRLIAYRNENITRQRLAEISNTVIPTTKIEDPLYDTQLRIVDWDWNQSGLKLVLSHPVNQNWQNAFYNMKSFTSAMGRGPQQFTFQGNYALIQADEDEIQRIIDYFKTWIPQVTNLYKRIVEQKIKEVEERERASVQRERDELERRQRLKKSIRL